MSDKLLNQLERELALMVHPLDVPRNRTLWKLDAYNSKRAGLEYRIHTLRDGPEELLSMKKRLARFEKWKKCLEEWKTTILGELEALPESEVDKRQNLSLSVQTIDQGGEAYRDSGYDLTTLRVGALMRGSKQKVWLGSLPRVIENIKMLTTRSEALQLRINDMALSDAERDAKNAAFRVAQSTSREASG